MNTLKFAVMAMFKNERMVIREWIEHYIWQGADMILLLNNNSTDDWKSKIHGYEDKVTVLDAPLNHAQNQQYNSIGIPWLKERKVDILAILDLDEFMFGTDGKSLKQHVIDIFGKANRPSRIFCRWTMFGSSDLEMQPESVRKSFIWKAKTPSNLPNVKSISWFADIKAGGASLHESDVTGRVEECPPTIQLNHYAIQSKQYFKEVKMTRGNATSPQSNSIRNWNYFEAYNSHDLEDTTLKTLVEAHEKILNKPTSGGKRRVRKLRKNSTVRRKRLSRLNRIKKGGESAIIFTELVVARFSEDLKWIPDLPFQRIRVYNKGPHLTLPYENTEVINLPNLGREAHTYLHHIIENYENLADMTLFLPGSVRSKPFKSEQLDKIMASLKSAPTKSVIVENKGLNKNAEKGFTITNHVISNNGNRALNPRSSLNAANTNPLGPWFAKYLPNEEMRCMSTNGIFAASREDIRKRPLEEYKRLIKTVSTENPVAVHYLERVWANVVSIDTCI